MNPIDLSAPFDLLFFENFAPLNFNTLCRWCVDKWVGRILRWLRLAYGVFFLLEYGVFWREVELRVSKTSKSPARELTIKGPESNILLP